jgi:CheY-like chemotaxis protein
LEPNFASTARILLVDDDLVFGEAIASALRVAGFEVSLAPDYRLALEDLESTRPIDLLVTDIVVPERVNGVALSHMARMRPSRSTTSSSSPRSGALWRPADTGAQFISVVFRLLGRSKFVDLSKNSVVPPSNEFVS